MHPDIDYRENSTFSSACHKPTTSSNSSGRWGSPGARCDAPVSLAEKTVEWISNEWADKLDFILWTGDNARHGYDKKLKKKRSSVYKSNKLMTDLMLKSFKNIPVIPNFGNNDVFPHNQMGNHKKEANFLDFYAKLWSQWIPKDQKATFLRGGYFSLHRPHFHIISLNTIYFFKRNKEITSCQHMNSPGFLQFLWFENELKLARSLNKKAYVIGHVPPSSSDYKSACLSQYLELASDYKDVIEGHFFAHLNMDHFLIYDGKPQDISINRNVKAYASWLYDMYDNLARTQAEPNWVVIQVSPSVLPVYYPTFRIYQYQTDDKNTKQLLGYSQYYSNITHWNQYDHLEYELEYTTKDNYQMKDLSPESYFNLAKKMVNHKKLWSLYREHMMVKTKRFTSNK